MKLIASVGNEGACYLHDRNVKDRDDMSRAFAKGADDHICYLYDRGVKDSPDLTSALSGAGYAIIEEGDVYQGAGPWLFAVEKNRIVELHRDAFGSRRYVSEAEAKEKCGAKRWCKRAENMLRALIEESRKEAKVQISNWIDAQVAQGRSVFRGIFSCQAIYSIKRVAGEINGKHEI